MLKVTAQGIEELKNILEQMKCSGCGDEHTHGESDCGSHSHCGCGYEGHADLGSECDVSELTLRLVVMGDCGFGLIPDIFREGDQAIEHEGAKVLLVDPKIAESVRELTLDCVSVPGGRALTFIPGKA